MVLPSGPVNRAEVTFHSRGTVQSRTGVPLGTSCTVSAGSGPSARATVASVVRTPSPVILRAGGSRVATRSCSHVPGSAPAVAAYSLAPPGSEPLRGEPFGSGLPEPREESLIAGPVRNLSRPRHAKARHRNPRAGSARSSRGTCPYPSRIRRGCAGSADRPGPAAAAGDAPAAVPGRRRGTCR